MKSMLQEASTIFKAIEKAWYSCGEPEEFIIKILEYEKKSFLGIIKHPAVISITYDTEKQRKKVSPELLKQEKMERAKEVQIKREREAAKKAKEAKHLAEIAGGYRKELIHGWTKELVNDVTAWFKEITSVMDIKIGFSLKVDQKILNIYLDKSILQESEDEKMFFISLSHLLMQFLKRKYKKKFTNFYLIIHSKALSKDGT